MNWDKITNSGASSSSNARTTTSTNTPTTTTTTNTPTTTTTTNTPTTTSTYPAHGQVTVNMLERNLFSGKQLNTAVWNDLEDYCKAGPTHLVISDMLLVPGQMSRAGFPGRQNLLWYVLSRTYAGANWSPGDDSEARVLYDMKDEIYSWWDRYLAGVISIMQRAPQTTATIIVNDAVDHCGRSLGNGSYQRMSSLGSRVSMGSTVPD